MKTFMAWCAPALLFNVVLALEGSTLQDEIQEALEKIAKDKSEKYNCSFSIGVKNKDMSVGAAAGTVDFSTGQQAHVSDKYAWGSITKILTGASILKLVAEGAFSLDDPIAPLVDPILSKMAKADSSMKYASLADLWGASNVSNSTVREILSMTSRVPDFDTAVPDFGKHAATDSLRQRLYDQGAVGLSPSELLSLPWVAHNWNGPCRRFMPLVLPFCYSSTGYMLLGLILASHAGANSTADFDQHELLPMELREEFVFPVKGVPKDYTEVHGYDRTSYNMPRGEHNDHDVSGVGGVFSGWTASNTLASATAVADLIWQIYGPPKAIAPPEYAAMMPPRGMTIMGVTAYGLATCQFDLFTGHVGKYGVAYGHSGATYGYQSIAVYFPQLELSITVATNIETDYQQQPAEALCFAYSAVATRILGKRSHCVYKEVKNYYVSGCACTPFLGPRDPATNGNESFVFV